MTSVSTILAGRAGNVIRVEPDATVLQSLEVMAKHNVGAVMVMEGSQLVGILTERDYARKIVLQGKASDATKVKDIMSTKVVCATPQMTLESAMAVTREKNIRHLPVVDESKKVLGMISIRDLVNAIVDEQKLVIEQLQQYISS